MRSLAADDSRSTLGALGTVLMVLGAWTGWLCLARVPVYERTANARLQVDRAVHAIEAPVAGRIVATRLVLGARVTAGDVLAELDVQAERFARDEQRARLASLAPQIDALRAQAAAADQGLSDAIRQDHAATLAAHARAREADSLAAIAREEAERNTRLAAQGHVAVADGSRARAEADRRQAAAEGLHLEAERLAWEGRTAEGGRRAEVARLHGEIARLEGDQGQITASLLGMDLQIQRRSIVAPVSGRVGQVSDARVGTVVAEGAQLGSIVPDGVLRVVAQFPPPTALGRVRAGQPARVRLDGFPWTQFGTVSAVVRSVGTEARDGAVRVELSVRPDARSHIPMQHGLLGSVEVEVERVSPATLVLRAAGQALDVTAAPSAVPSVAPAPAPAP